MPENITIELSPDTLRFIRQALSIAVDRGVVDFDRGVEVVHELQSKQWKAEDLQRAQSFLVLAKVVMKGKER